MIRLWNRVGGFRVLAVALLLVGVAGGIAMDNRRTTQQSKAAATARAEAARISDEEASRARREAQEKADAAAVTASTQARAVAEANKPSAKPSTAPPVVVAPPTFGPIPASCSEYTANRGIGCAILLEVGFGLDQMPCLDKLFTKESNWRVNASNPSSGAYGIPQALPGSKMATVGADWQTNPATQIRWGLGYIKGRYSTPCGAWSHSMSTGWY